MQSKRDRFFANDQPTASEAGVNLPALSDLDPIIREKELPPDDHRWEANKKRASDARTEVGTGDKLCTDDIAQPIISEGFTSCRPFIIVNVDTQNTIFLHCNNKLTIRQAALLYFFLQEEGNKQGVYLKKGSLPGFSMPTFVQYLKERVEMKSIGFRNFCDVIFLPKEGCILRRSHRSNTILEDRPFDSSYYSALEKGHVKSKESIEKQAEEFVANWERGEQLNKALYPLVKNKNVGEIKNLLRDSGKNISQIIKPNIYDLLNYEERKSFSNYSSHNLNFSRLIRLVTLDLDGGRIDKHCLTKEGLQKSLECFKLLDDLLLQAGNIDESHSFFIASVNLIEEIAENKKYTHLMECQEFTALVEFTRKSATDSSDKKRLEEVELKANIMKSKFEKFDELPTELQFETDKVYQP